ncbi:MAG: ABC transporter permease [Burkholderiales bacterium]|jgi:tungstate transport system permease protein|nr:ABC transporter permease [Burkholderiales bacterium]
MLSAINDALLLLGQPDSGILGIVRVSLQVSFSALLLGCLVGLPLGALLATESFPGRKILIVIVNSLMGVPTVVVGVVVYLLLSHTGPIGNWGWLFTIKGMILAQFCLTTPLIAALSRQLIEDAWIHHRESFSALQLAWLPRLKWLIWDCRFSLSIVLLAGLARAISEIGAVMIVGGNIDHHTRTMTTAIALETSKGDLPLALALGLVLMSLVIGANLITYLIRHSAEQRYG